VSPPLVMTDDQVGEIAEAVAEALTT
jgi:adenosylmethionine-8-amino-7-oxononanoate aminotransferase